MQSEDEAALGLDTAPAEFYDPAADERDEKWAAKQRAGRKSDAILSCPGCLTTVCIDCQQHADFEGQFRAMFTLNCRCKSFLFSWITPASLWLAVGYLTKGVPVHVDHTFALQYFPPAEVR